MIEVIILKKKLLIFDLDCVYVKKAFTAEDFETLIEKVSVFT